VKHRAVCAIGLALAGVVPARTAAAQPELQDHIYVIAVGYNGLPVNSGTALEPLRFADDDAIAFATFASEGAQQTHLLTVVDGDTQRRLGASIPPVDPPTKAGLLAAVADVRGALEADARAGIESTVYLYYSGHGTDEVGRVPALALLDTDLTRELLYNEVLAALPATYVHLFVDACHGEGVVRPRDAQAQLVPTSPSDITESAATSTLARFPSVGAIVGATRGAQTHEWADYSGGVFTHELLSGLRGAADVDGNGRIEYSEIAAFLSAANGSVADPRARLEPVIHAPIANPRAVIVDLRARVSDAVIDGPAGQHGLFSIENERGDQIVDLRAEVGYRTRLVVPSSMTLYIRSDRGEAAVHPSPGGRVELASLAFHAARSAERGSLDSALRRGLFATPFGRSYYRGFVDRGSDLVAVPLSDLPPEDDPVESPAVPVKDARSSRTVGWVVLGAAGATAIGAGVFGVLAVEDKSKFDNTPFERAANDAASRYTTDTTAFVTLAGCAVVASVIGTYLLAHSGTAPTPAHAGFVPGSASFAF
jgi:hypothetical protein